MWSKWRGWTFSKWSHCMRQLITQQLLRLPWKYLPAHNNSQQPPALHAHIHVKWHGLSGYASAGTETVILRKADNIGLPSHALEWNRDQQTSSGCEMTCCA
jgi:hypothetical protein